jgi:hypothetical protein
MPQLGWLSPDSGKEVPFDEALASAEAYGSWMGFPFEILRGMYEQLDKSDRPDGVTVTQLNGCARSKHLDATEEYFSDPLQNYPAFRGTLAHAMIEKFKPAGAIIEERYFRKYRGIEISGQIDSWRIMNAPDQVTKDWHEWLVHMMHTEVETKGYQGKLEPPFSFEQCEMGAYAVCPGRTRPELPEGARLLIRDWKTKKAVPTYPYLDKKYQSQGNIYRWMLRWEDLNSVDIEFVFIAMDLPKIIPLLNGGTYSNGRAKPKQFLTDKQLYKFFDDRLVTLAVTKSVGRPLPYALVPTEDLWQCAEWCPVKNRCYQLAADEARQAWAKGETVDRLPPRDRKAEEKAS